MSDNLCSKSRTINHFCFILKKHYKLIAAFSVRRGKVFVKVTPSCEWKMVRSLEELHRALQHKLPAQIPK